MSNWWCFVKDMFVTADLFLRRRFVMDMFVKMFCLETFCQGDVLYVHRSW